MPKFSCTSSGCGRHSEIRRHSVLCTGAPTSLPRELHSSDLHMRSRGVPERAHRRTSPLPRACSVNPGLCCSFMKSTRLRLDPQGYIAGDAGVTQRSAHKRSLQCSTTLCPCETEREHEMAAWMSYPSALCEYSLTTSKRQILPQRV